MKYLIDPNLKVNGGGGCQKKGAPLCPGMHPQPLYGIIVPA